MKQFFLLSIVSFSFCGFAKENISYPVTKKVDHTDTYFGTTVEDPYQWLEDDTCAATTAWVDAENKVTTDYLSKIPYRKQLKDRYKELYDYAKLADPVIAGDYIFYQKKTGMQNQMITYMQKGTKGVATVFIDPNKIDPKGLTTLEISSVSDDNKYVTVTQHKAGSDWQEMFC